MDQETEQKWRAYFASNDFRKMRTATITPEVIRDYTTPESCYHLVQFCTQEHKYWMCLRGEFPKWQLGYIYHAAAKLGTKDRIYRRSAVRTGGGRIEGLVQNVRSGSNETCTGTRTDGKPCKASAMPGQELCYWHQS